MDGDNDGMAGGDFAPIPFVVEPNATPIAVADDYIADENQTLTVDQDRGVLANDRDDDGDARLASYRARRSSGRLHRACPDGTHDW